MSYKCGNKFFLGGNVDIDACVRWMELIVQIMYQATCTLQ
jgi:hypothetical protein